MRDIRWCLLHASSIMPSCWNTKQGSNVELWRKQQFATQTQQFSRAGLFVGCSFLCDWLECVPATTLWNRVAAEWLNCVPFDILWSYSCLMCGSPVSPARRKASKGRSKKKKKLCTRLRLHYSSYQGLLDMLAQVLNSLTLFTLSTPLLSHSLKEFVVC